MHKNYRSDNSLAGRATLLVPDRNKTRPTLALLLLLSAGLAGLTVNAAPPDSSRPVLTLSKEDLILQEGTEGGYHLWIRQKPGMNSVLLTESSNDPQKKLHIYALRAPGYNPINGDEKRLINGKFITTNIGIIDSTPEPHELLGQAFHLFIPYVVEYGYTGGRSGQIQITVGSFLNIKAFALPYGDWSGAQQDNPFVLALESSLEQTAAPAGKYLEETVQEFSTIARDGGGEAFLVPDGAELIAKIRTILEQEPAETLDLVIALDTTLSMKEELPYLQKELVPLLSPSFARFKQFRVGILFYKDYYELYLTKPFAFTEKINDIQKIIDQARPHGGKEIPEAVYEALNSCLDYYTWTAASRLLLLIGDAPPHPLPRDKTITKESVTLKAQQKSVVIHTFILGI